MSYSAAIRSVPWTPGQALLLFLMPWVLLPLAFMIGVEVASYYLPFLQSFKQSLISGEPEAAFVVVLIDLIGSIAIIGYLMRKHHVGLSSIGIRRFSLVRTIMYIILLVLSFGFLVAAASFLVELIYPAFDPAEEQSNEFISSPTSLSLWALVVIPPIIEETVFRGFVFPAFAKRYGIVFGAIISSLLFAVAHWQLNVGIYTFVLGLLLCFLYVRLGSIIPGIGLHMLNNYIAYMALQQK